MSTLEDTIVSNLNMNAKSVNLDGVTEWGGPSVQGQMSNEQSWDIKKACVRVFDLQHKEDVECYENLLSESMVTDPIKVITDQEKRFSDKTNNWLVYVTYVEIVYKKLTGNKKA